MVCPSPSLLINFGLRSILLGIKIATPACLLGTFAWKIFFPILYPEVMSIIDVEVCFLYAAEKWILFLHPFCHSVNFY